MNLSKICINARPRTPWEAVDLGIVLTRAWWLPLFLIWFIPAFSLFILLSLVLPNNSWVAYLVVWWLKPIFDRGPLYIASQRLFNEPISLRAALKKLPTLYTKDALLWLTFRRLSVTRSFDMPITILEQLRGQERNRRQSILHSQYKSTAAWLSIILIHIEMVFIIAAASFLVIMIPDNITLDYWSIALEQQQLVTWAYNICAFLTMSLIAPFYAVCGFCLYISRRIDLEAWDIEIRFRHLAAAYQSGQKNHNLTSTLLVITLGIFSLGAFTLAPKNAIAQTAEQQAKQDITHIMERQEFRRIEKVSGWRLKNQIEEEPEVPAWLKFIAKKITHFIKSGNVQKNNGSHFVSIIEWLLWALVLGLIGLIVYRYRSTLRSFLIQPSKKSLSLPPPKILFGLDVRKESLPQDIVMAVQTLWQQGQHRNAVSLLYRSLLSRLIHEHNIILCDSHTENECVRIVQELNNHTLSVYMQTLTTTWQQLAYGHQHPTEAEVKQLCQQWEQVFDHA